MEILLWCMSESPPLLTEAVQVVAAYAAGNFLRSDV